MTQLVLLVYFLTHLLNPSVFCLKPTCLSTISDCPDINPDEDLDTVQIATRHGYSAETHTIATEDGYILTLHRIQSATGSKNGQPVFFQHGLLSSSADWIIAGNNSLPFMLADAGYDIWLGNARGNVYSKAHVNFSIHSPQYWNFSWHEMGYYDLPAALYHVSNITNKPGEILYVGHSMGTTMFFVFASTRPQAAKNVKLMVAYAPVAYMTHLKSPIRYLAPFSKDFQWVAKYLGINQFLPQNKILKLLSYECEIAKFDKEICENIIFVLCGFDKEDFNDALLPVILSHDPAGTSTKTVIHYAQEIQDEGNFQQFDYGKEGNMIKYGRPTPPLYKFANIKVPIYMMYALNDYLASPIDVLRLSQNLTNLVGLYQVPSPKFNHLDFIYAKDIVTLVNEPVIKLFRNYTD